MKNHKVQMRRNAAFVMAVAMVTSLSWIAPTNAAPAKIKGNNLVVAIDEFDAGLCLQDSPGAGQGLIKASVSENLFAVNNKGKTVPYLAKSVGNSADFKTWKFTLREGIFFHDGEELTAATVATNVAGNLGLTTKASLPAIAWQDAFGGVTSLAQFAAKVQPLSKYVIQFNLGSPRPNLPDLLNGFRSNLLSSKTIANPKCGVTVLAGTGPFMIQSKGTDNTKTVLVANPNYWRKDAQGKSLPKAKTLTFLTVVDASQRRAALLKGQVHLATFGATSGNLLNQMKKDKGLDLFEGPRDMTWSLHLNSAVAPFNNRNARLAFSYAIDREAVVKILTKGNSDPAYCFGATYHPYNISKGGKKCAPYDLKKAKGYVAAYQQETGKQMAVVLPTTESQESIKYHQAVCGMIVKAGATCALMPPVNATAYILRGFALRQQVSNFNVVFGYSANFANLFATKTNLELSGFRFTNPGLAACFQEAQRTAAKAKYQKCVAVLHGDAYWVPQYTEGPWLGASKSLVFSEGLLPGRGKRRPIDAKYDFATITVSD